MNELLRMTSKERVLCAIQHRPMDRVPVNYLGTPETDAKLRSYFGIDLSIEPEPPGGTVEYDWDILGCLGADLRALRLPYRGPAIPTFDDGRAQDIFGVTYRPVSNEVGTYLESATLPYASFATVTDVEAYPWPDPAWFDYSALPPQCEQWKDYAVVYGSVGNVDLINGTAFGRGVEQTIMDIALEDPVGLAVMEKRFEFGHEQTRLALEACGGKVDIVWMGDDYGTQRGLLMSPAKWRKLFRAKLQAMVDLAHKHGARLMLHSCGSTRQIWPDFVDIGLDIYDTVQPSAAGMVPNELATEFGRNICLHGTINTQSTLPYGTPSDVRKEVRDRIESFGNRGGLIVAPCHNVQPDTPIENVLALYREAGSLGSVASQRIAQPVN
jgi:uroporphyrinogen decarboxylase